MGGSEDLHKNRKAGGFLLPSTMAMTFNGESVLKNVNPLIPLYTHSRPIMRRQALGAAASDAG
jgi:hypothetical protein